MANGDNSTENQDEKDESHYMEKLRQSFSKLQSDSNEKDFEQSDECTTTKGKCIQDIAECLLDQTAIEFMEGKIELFGDDSSGYCETGDVLLEAYKKNVKSRFDFYDIECFVSGFLEEYVFESEVNPRSPYSRLCTLLFCVGSFSGQDEGYEDAMKECHSDVAAVMKQATIEQRLKVINAFCKECGEENQDCVCKTT